MRAEPESKTREVYHSAAGAMPPPDLHSTRERLRAGVTNSRDELARAVALRGFGAVLSPTVARVAPAIAAAALLDAALPVEAALAA